MAFRFCELGEVVADAKGLMRDDIAYADLANFLFFLTFGEPLPVNSPVTPPFVGSLGDAALYLIYGGRIRNQTKAGGNWLTRPIFDALHPFDGRKIIYCGKSQIEDDKNTKEEIWIKEIPWKIKVPE